MTASYFDYYDRTIQHNQNGLKKVMGGTGLGKTSIIAKVVSQSNTERKFIYCANRIQLLNEMKERLPEGQYVHLKKDPDCLQDVLQRQGETFYQFLESALVKKYAERIKRKGAADIHQVRRACEYVEKSRQVKDLAILEEALNAQVRVVFNFFKAILKEAAGKPEHQLLLDNQFIRGLFPYITFRQDERVRILLVTIQKAFFGFFDGWEDISLTKLQGRNGNNIIFLDEFDFLESNLIDLICQDAQIDAPFKFVEFFYGAMKRHKLPLAIYPIEESIRQQIEEIVALVDELKTEHSLRYPDINQFTCKSTELKGQAIFQTNRSILNKRLYLQDAERSFEIVPNSDGGQNLNAIILFNAIQRATSQILFLFKELEANPILYTEILRHCFENTTFKVQIGRIRQLPNRKRKQATRFDNLLDSGYGLYEILDLQQETDKDEVEFRHYALYTTPERVLLSVASNNLIFGLSATADIPRLVRSFSEEWLQRQEGFILHEVDEDDIAIIQALNREKQQRRANSVILEKADDLDLHNSFQQKLLKFIEAIAIEDGFGGDDRRGLRRKRAELFFATLLWVISNRSKEQLATDTHLLFFNSYTQIEHIFTHHQEPEDDLFLIKKMGQEAAFQYYEINILDTDFIVIFYNAAKGQQIESETRAKEQYHHLFWEGKPVLLVTTYPSAGNGINLQYYPDEQSKRDDEMQKAREREKDFKNIHLLDGPYFYFGKVEFNNTEQENNAIIKQNIWYLAKLYEAKIISEQQFKNHLANIRNNQLSNYYRTQPETGRDSILNQLATFIQALGRVERVWSAMDDQTVRLRREVYQVFEVFCTRLEYEHLRETRQKIISNNLQQVFDHITEQSNVSVKQMRRVKDERLATINQICKDKIQILLNRLVDLRQGNGDTEAKEDWLQLRLSALKHDFLCPTLNKQYHCLFETDYYDNGKIHLNDELELFPKSLWNSDIRIWDLNSIYYLIAENDIVRRHFEARGYELGFNNLTRQFFTPYCYQSILVGAIGEEAIKAVLQHERISFEEIEDQLFEVADLKVASLPFYIDCKNFSERTLEAFPLSPSDPGWQPNLNEMDFKPAAQRKLAKICNLHGRDSKLIYINLVSMSNRIKRYYDAEFNPVDDFEAAQIVVIQGVLNRDRPNEYNQPFNVFMHHLKSSIEGRNQ
ncbi:MAG: hypothetical protein KJ077_27825 [Anaerolineae bacterium]|nr:hypothetical protein [Anaerolineae bacterium]